MADPAAARGSAAAGLVVDRDPIERAAALLGDRLRALAMRPAEIRLAIPGGSALAAALRAWPAVAEIVPRIALTWVDERCVAAGDPASNRGEALRRGLLSAARPARVLPLFEDGETPEAAVKRVTRRYVEEFEQALDVVLLGMGEDGHVASLFPDHDVPAAGFIAAVADAPKPPARRMTLTRAALASATHTVLVATGEAKRPALERLLAGDPRLPATGLPDLVVVTDLEL